MQKDFMSMAQGQQAANDPRQNVLDNLVDIATQAKILTKTNNPKIMPKLEELADLIMSDDQQAVESNELYQILMQTLAKAEELQDNQQQPTGGPVPQQGAAPKDFASMMPPTPGGTINGGR
jgi:hypothetical protein